MADPMVDPNAAFAQLQQQVNNFLEREESAIVDSLIRNTLEPSLLNMVQATTHVLTKALYEFIVAQCQHSDRHHKIALLDKVVALIADPNLANDSTLVKWTQLGTDLAQLKMTLDKALGIFLQSSYKPPAGVNRTTFDFSVSQTLDAKTSPTLKDVASVIQFATSKGKTKGATTDPTSMDLDHINAFQGRSSGK
ncbi:hypothetical protein PTTG_05447 [Puccinia triticina 1-1 BBBD Race 1]|uniref:Uncharacterized protein n=1 Tax=Puccinia triticina (isolate 1-1 / race 1 (BBBD)) TaxID=630390 RepID=A0A180GS95_PUCT1|nr:hypothetical protein PTTG_05447 [Puccinia triticina 1-1 BBBD Race 1]